MNKIIIFVLSLVLISCEKKDYVEEFKFEDYKVRKEFKSGKIVNSKSFDKKGILQMEVFYKNDKGEKRMQSDLRVLFLQIQTHVC